MDIYKIVVTGGPSGGKTTGLSWIQNEFTKLGYTVLFVPETATELITGGVTPWTCGTNLDYQQCQMRLQLEKEKIFDRAARSMRKDKILIVCDRGALDNRAYMNEEEFATVLDTVGATREELLARYGAVFHLVSAAKGVEQFYNTENNKARYETAQEAAALDDKLIEAWEGHPYHRVIDNSSNFEDKLKRLIVEIRTFLGEPLPLEIERKFLVKYPDIAWVQGIPGCRKVEILQTYLLSKEDDELRVRQRRENGTFVYYKTWKRRLTERTRIEVEEKLSQDEYLTLLMEADPAKHSIRKTRYCFTWEEQYFELDVYPTWSDQAILEVELKDEDEEIRYPEGLKVIREVTGDPEYSNAALAKR